MMKKDCSILAAFTLIELLVVISIIGILFTVGMAAYNEFNRGQILSQAAKTLKNDLRLAQSKASAGEKDSSSCVNKTLEGWFVSFTSSSYTLYGSCDGTQFGQKIVNLPANVSLFTCCALGPLQFRPLAQGISPGVTITLSAFGKTQLIIVGTSGDIN